MRPVGAPLALCACNLSPFTALRAHRAKPACVWNSPARCNGAGLFQALRHGFALCEGLATRRLSGVAVGILVGSLVGRRSETAGVGAVSAVPLTATALPSRVACWGDWLGACLGGVARGQELGLFRLCR